MLFERGWSGGGKGDNGVLRGDLSRVGGSL